MRLIAFVKQLSLLEKESLAKDLNAVHMSVVTEGLKRKMPLNNFIDIGEEDGSSKTDFIDELEGRVVNIRKADTNKG